MFFHVLFLKCWWSCCKSFWAILRKDCCFGNTCESLLIWADGYDSAKILTRTGAEETRLQYFQNLEYIKNDCNVALFLASAVREKYLQMSEYWLQKILKPTRPWGPGLSNFCCLYNFNTAHHWEIIYLKELWPNLASNAVCQCLQMYCFLLHSLMLSMVLWEHHLTTSENMSAICCELSKQLQLFSFPANSLQQLLPSALQQLTTAFI